MMTDAAEMMMYSLGAKSLIKAVGPAMIGADVAMQAVFAPKGRMMGDSAGALIGNGLQMGAGLMGGPLGIAGAFLGYKVGQKLSDAYDSTIKGLNATRHLNFGGNYKDTAVAYTMRQKAAQELGGSLLNARQFLGKESVLMHQ